MSDRENLAELLWEQARDRRAGYPSSGYGIEYVNGWEDAATWLEVHLRAVPVSDTPPTGELEEHPERRCAKCGGPNIIWSAPSPLWNAVMRGNDINGVDEHDGIVCPVCFAVLAQERVGASVWRFWPERVEAALTEVTPSGRVWDGVAWLWREPQDPSGVSRGT
jgi:hypothetical protein